MKPKSGSPLAFDMASGVPEPKRMFSVVPYAVLFLTLLCAAPAAAYSDDVALRSLGRPKSAALADPATLRYRALTSEIILALAPTPMESAESLGESGFAYSIGLRGTQIHANVDFWRGQPNSPVLEAPLAKGGVPDVLWTPTLTFAKGLPLSSEVSVTGSFLPHSHMAMVSANFKVALHENYVRWLPSLAVRFGVHRMIGAADFDATGGDASALVSYPIPIAGTLVLTPTVSYSRLYTQVQSATLDSTPFAVTDPLSDQKNGPNGSLYEFPTLGWRTNVMPRFAGGLRVQLAMLTVLYEFSSSSYGNAPSSITGHSIVVRLDT